MNARVSVALVVFCLVGAAGAFAAEQYYLPQVADGRFEGGSFKTTFVLFNNTDADVTASVKLTGDDGNPLAVGISGLGRVTEFNVFLARGATEILQTDATGPLTAGAATVSSSAKIGVSAIFTNFDPNGAYLTEAGVGSSEPQTEFILPTDTTGLFNTGLALYNPGTGTASVALEMRNTDGQTVGNTAIDLPAKGHLARFVLGAGQLFPAVGALQGTLHVQSSVPISALVLRQNQTPLSYTSLPVVPASSTAQTRNLAQVANGSFGEGSFKTSFLVFNLSPNAANVTLTLTKDDGTPFAVTIGGKGTNSTFTVALPGRGSAFLQTDGSGAVNAGAAVITSTAPVGAAGIFTVTSPQGAFQTEAGVGDSPVLSNLTFPVDMSGSFETGFAFFNPGTSAASLTLKLLDANGVPTGARTVVTLDAKKHTARFISELFDTAPGFRGTVTVSSTAAIAALTLRQNPAPLSYTTLPVASGISAGGISAPVLLTRTDTGLAVTADTNFDATLLSGFRVTGQAGNAGQAHAIVAERNDGTLFTGQLNAETGAYLVAVPAGTYRIRVCYKPDVAGANGLMVSYAEPSQFQVSSDTVHNVSLPAVPVFAVSGLIGGFAGLPLGTSPRIVFTSGDNTIQGAFDVASDGSYHGVLPVGSYGVGFSVSSVQLTAFQHEDLGILSLGTASVAGAPLTANFTAPATSRVTGVVRASWLGQFAFGINVFATDTGASSPAGFTCVAPPAESGAGADPSGQYQMVLARDRSYAMDVLVPLTVSQRNIGTVGFPASPGLLNLGSDSTYNFGLPDLPGQVKLAGKVVDRLGRGIEGVTVRAYTNAVTSTPNVNFVAIGVTDAGGNYSLTVVSGTNYQLMFIPPTQ